MEDLIKRSDAIEAVICKTTFESEDAIMAMMTIVGEVMNNIANIPSVDRPQGEWIGEADGYYNGELVYDTWYCSNCDYVVDDEEPPTWNFCPNCGADMRGEK